MNAIQKSRLARTVISLLQNYDRDHIVFEDREVVFDMDFYAVEGDDTTSDPVKAYECATSCCIVGYAAMLFKPTKKYNIDKWQHTMADLFGIGFNSKSYEFLFACKWSSDPKQAARRALEYLHRDVPESFGSASIYYKGYNDKEVIEELANFLLDNDELVY